MPRKKKNPADLAALEAAPLEPKPRRKKAAEAILESHKAKQAVEPDAPQPEPTADLPPPDKEIIPSRPTGPRKRDVNEPGSIYSGEKVRVTKDADTFMIEVKTPLTGEMRDGQPLYLPTAWQEKLIGYGFDDVSEQGNGSVWLASIPELRQGRPATANILLERINNIGPELDGKYERIGYGR